MCPLRSTASVRQYNRQIQIQIQTLLISIQTGEGRGPRGGGWALFLFSTLPPPPGCQGEGGPRLPPYSLPSTCPLPWSATDNTHLVVSLFYFLFINVFQYLQVSASRAEVVDVRHRDIKNNKNVCSRMLSANINFTGNNIPPKFPRLLENSNYLYSQCRPTPTPLFRCLKKVIFIN